MTPTGHGVAGQPAVTTAGGRLQRASGWPLLKDREFIRVAHYGRKATLRKPSAKSRLVNS